jgi:hypothetical protein
MVGLTSALHLDDWQLRQLNRVRNSTGIAHRFAAAGVRGCDRLLSQLPAAAQLMPVRLLRSLLPRLQRRLAVQLPVEAVCPVSESRTARPERIFLMVARDSPEIRVEPIIAREMVRRAIQMAHFEGLPLRGHYSAHQFAFPGRRNYLLEDSHHMETELLSRALARLEAWVVYHPRPVSLDLLYDAMNNASGKRRLAAARAAGAW